MSVLNKALKKENKKWPKQLKQLSVDEWPTRHRPINLVEVWRSRYFLVQLFSEHDVIRMSVCRTAVKGNRWLDNISWDALQKLKNECGRGHKPAVEIYPPDIDIVNVANMRHLWILNEAPQFMWTKR